ncbi:hypothetical protein EMA8858_00576 [Emticicia aquatica]|jgi:hypothetical protein|uniref:Photosystem II protein L n=1 Tax=Emticicia aquatica TaxID=1681835 RepID=A0ABM9AMI1_9BACT|nr:hypothetical protein [Emticicia aquatica]CAH0994466.1 hypothetical protein EMA8858_00576 [Emticicia aquatica]
MKNNDINSPSEAETDSPPILGTWRNVYTLVVGTLVLLIVLFYAFTLYFA